MDAVAEPPPQMTRREVFDAVAPSVVRLVERMVNRHPSQLASLRDDMIQVGHIELWRIAPDYEPARGQPSTFAMTRVKGAVIDWLRERRNMVGMRARLEMKRVKAGRDVAKCVSIDARKAGICQHNGSVQGSSSASGFVDPPVYDPEHADDPAAEIVAVLRTVGPWLTPSDRALLAEYATGATLREMADARGVSESLVYQQFTRAVGMVREEMDARELRTFE